MNLNYFFLLFSFSLTLFSCGEEYEQKQFSSTNRTKKISDTVSQQEIKHPKDENHLNTMMQKPSTQNSYKVNTLVDIQEINPSILVDLKYATEDNFTKKKLYTNINKAYLQEDVAKRLSAVQVYLKKLRPDLTLLVYDGTRPLSVQQEMWNALDTIPVKDRIKFVSNPASGSIHNYGAAVDLTLARNDGTPLDMGATYDDIRLIAYPSKEAYFLAKGELSEQQVENRKLLRQVMRYQGFTNISTEWWHFNACTRVEAKAKYHIVE